MNYDHLILIILGASIASIIFEKEVRWLTYFSSVCLLVMFAILLSFLGFVPNEHPMYDFILGPLVPVILILMVLALDLSKFREIPKGLLVSYGIGVLGTCIGGIVASLFCYYVTGDIDSLKLGAQLTGSYIGGGENAVALKEILEISNEKFVSVFAADNLVTSVWMIITLIWAYPEMEEKEKE